jgi:NTE family protein
MPGRTGSNVDAAAVRERDYSLALVLSGGNALGAYQAGAWQALHERGLEPDWVAGASAGAINGAVICGSPNDLRIERLKALWTPAAATPATSMSAFEPLEEARRTCAVAGTLAAGWPGLFVPRHLLGPWWDPFGNPEPSSLYDATPLIDTLERLVDFDLLNKGVPRYTATAVDIENGEDVAFDTRTHRIEPDHLRASSALLPAFSPVEIGGRLLGDAGISVNLPLDCVLGEPDPRPLLCVAVDLLPLRARRPQTLGDTVSRMQDLVFATQSRRAIAAWQKIFDLRAGQGDTAAVTLLHIAYSDQEREVSGKAFDFSPESAAARWDHGRSDMGGALDALASGEVTVGRPGMTVYTMTGERGLKRPGQVLWQLGPVEG